MNKSDLAKILSEKTSLRPEQSEDLISMVLSQMEKTLVEKKRVEIRGLGSFSTKEYKARWGRNPKTGEKIWVDEKHLPVFKLGKELKDRLNSDFSQEG